MTQAVTQPLVVGQFLGLAEDGRFVATGGVRPGDVLLQVGPVPIEGAAVLSHEASDRLIGLDPAVVEAALGALDHPGISVVEPALLAAELGATAMHDPTEGGLVAGLHEIAAASRLRIRVDLDSVLWFEPGRALCAALGADPLATLASGCLLAAFPADRAKAVLQSLAQHGHAAAQIGTAEPGPGVCDADGRPLAWPGRDGWPDCCRTRLRAPDSVPILVPLPGSSDPPPPAHGDLRPVRHADGRTRMHMGTPFPQANEGDDGDPGSRAPRPPARSRTGCSPTDPGRPS